MSFGSNFTRPGNDLLFKDTEVKSLINYRIVNYVNNNKKYNEQHIEEHIDLDYLIGLPSKKLLKIWQEILMNDKDTPYCFLVFANLLSKNEDFKCHNKNANNSTKNIRQWSISRLKINDRHRVETLPTNIDIPSLVKDVNEIFSIHTIINLANSKKLINSLIYNLNSLYWLNLNNSGLTTSGFKSIILSINVNKMPNLRGILVRDNLINKNDILSGLKSLKINNKLQYLETNLKLVGDDDNNKFLKNLDIKDQEFYLMTDAVKIKYLQEKGFINGSIDDNLIVDYQLVDNHISRGKVDISANFYCYLIKRRLYNNGSIQVMKKKVARKKKKTFLL